jgi:hypothetical protein
VVYRYLSARALIGRSTPSAIRGLTDILTENRDFAPAHRALAEICGSEAFNDTQKEQAEPGTFLGLVLDPGWHTDPEHCLVKVQL